MGRPPIELRSSAPVSAGVNSIRCLIILRLLWPNDRLSGTAALGGVRCSRWLGPMMPGRLATCNPRATNHDGPDGRTHADTRWLPNHAGLVGPTAMDPPAGSAAMTSGFRTACPARGV